MRKIYYPFHYTYSFVLIYILENVIQKIAFQCTYILPFFFIKKEGIHSHRHTYTLLQPTNCHSNLLINMVNQCSPFSQELVNEDYGLIEKVLAIQL